MSGVGCLWPCELATSCAAAVRGWVTGWGLGAGERGLGLVDGGRVGQEGTLAALLWTQERHLGSCHCMVVGLHGSLNGRDKCD